MSLEDSIMTKFFVFLLLLLPVSIHSQVFSDSFDVPALTSGPSRPSGGSPMIEFDRRLLVQISGPTPSEMCLYINTVTGDIGITYGRVGELGACELNVNDRKFRFMLVRSSGQVQTYMTVEKNGALKHYMSTGNTEIFPVSFPPMENTDLHRFGSVVPGRRRGGVESRAYRANASAPTFYLHGRTDPATVTTQGFLGHSGIGYLKTNRGIFMVVRAELGSTEFRAYSWSEVPTRLDPDLFEQLEVIMNEKYTASLDRQEEKIRADEPTGDCASEETELNRLKLADVQARRGLNRERNSGNVYENESVRRASGEMMTPNLAIMNQEVELKICKANVRLSRTRGETARAGIERRIQCYREQKIELNRLQMEWDAIDARYPNDAGRAYAEKNRTYMRLMSLASQCR
jgi:hypothetical protein